MKMETKKIRIGNDIQLTVDLRQYIGLGVKESEVYTNRYSDFENLDKNPIVDWPEVYWPNEYDEDTDDHYNKVCIKSIKAFFINKSSNMKYKFIGRFPTEPYSYAFEPSGHNIFGCGRPHWHHYPVSRKPYMYYGFGIYPDWRCIYNDLPHAHSNKYPAFVKRVEVEGVLNNSKVEVYFPAKVQREIGMYDLVIMANLFCPEFPNKIRTITIDIPNVFQLVKSSVDSDSDVFSLVKIECSELPEFDSGEEFSGDRYLNNVVTNNEDHTITFERNDGTNFSVDLDDMNDWYIDSQNQG